MAKLSKDRLKELYEESFVKVKEGEIVEGTIVKNTGKVVMVDLGVKSEGLLDVDEFSSPDEIEEGHKVFVYVEALEGPKGAPVISKRKADFQMAWDKIKEKSEKAEGLEVRVKKRVKGGLAVEVFGLDAFLPGSQIDIKPVSNLDELINKTLEVKIVKVNWAKKNIVVSRRLLLEERLKEARERIFETVSVGDVIDGTVQGFTDFGAFIDIGGVDALLHITEISWNKIVHPSEVLNLNEKIKVKVLSLDRSSGRITVGLKQLTPHPWEGIEKKYSIGSRVKGRVISLMDYGAFIELEKGIEGLIHISEMSWTKSIRHPKEILTEDDIIECVVLNIDKESQRISLGLKQTQPDPWSIIDEKYSVGQKVSGVVKSLKEFGAFVEIEEGIEGLVHISDLSWTNRVQHPREVLKKGQRVETIILSIDKEHRRVALGYKQTREDPFYGLTRDYKEGAIIKGKIVDLPTGGIVADVGYGIESYVPLHQLLVSDLKEAKKAYKVDQELVFMIRRIDFGSRKLILKEVSPDAKSSKKPPPRQEKDHKFTLEDHIK